MTELESQATAERFSYEAEVGQVMNIVINSLYTEREIFVRELVSNAADALEKVRHLQLTGVEVVDSDLPLEIRIEFDPIAGSLTIRDTGIGMNREELITNLGRIAHSGSREFLSTMAESLRHDVSLIGQFGIGFYSSFIVAREIRVATRSAAPGSRGFLWLSTGPEGFTITPVEGLARGTSVTVSLKEGDKLYSEESTIRRIIKFYSNFVPFPIFLKGEKVNSIQAIWIRNPSEIKDEEYTEFFRFITGTGGEPLERLHFTTDAPLSLRAILFIPPENQERFGFGRMEPAVDLHCRKVLIQKNAPGVLPQWLRFLKGVVDSEDLPLNISRETIQDSSLVKRLNRAITSRFLKFLKEKAEKEPANYERVWKNFGPFFKEGIVTDSEYKDGLAPLLRFESSRTKPDETCSLDAYCDRVKENQREIYYLNGSSRENLEASPYLEYFRKNDLEVLYTFDSYDDFALASIGEFRKLKLVSADSEKIDLAQAENQPPSTQAGDGSLTESRKKELLIWMKEILGDRVSDIRESHRLIESPVMLVNPGNHLSGSVARILQRLDHGSANVPVGLILDYNPGHNLVRGLDHLRTSDPAFAPIFLEQLFDQAAMAAGFNVASEPLIKRMSTILEKTFVMPGSNSAEPNQES